MNIRNLVLTLALSLSLFAVPAFAQDNPQQQRSSGEERAAHFNLVTGTYRALSSLVPEDRRSRYAGLSRQLKGDLWRLQLDNLLASCPEFDDEQRSIIAGWISLIDDGLFVGDHSSAEWEGIFQSKLQYLQTRTQVAFSPHPLDSFFMLRPRTPVPLTPGETSEAAMLLARAKKVVSDSCDCLAGSIWNTCSFPTTNNCLDQNQLRCTRTQDGCGFLQMYGCSGTCG